MSKVAIRFSFLFLLFTFMIPATCFAQTYYWARTLTYGDHGVNANTPNWEQNEVEQWVNISGFILPTGQSYWLLYDKSNCGLVGHGQLLEQARIYTPDCPGAVGSDNTYRAIYADSNGAQFGAERLECVQHVPNGGFRLKVDIPGIVNFNVEGAGRFSHLSVCSPV